MNRQALAVLGVGLSVLLAVTPANSAAGGATNAAETVSFRKVADSSTAIGFAERHDGVVFVVEQRGTLRPLLDDRLGPPVIDLSKRVSDGNEQGLLGAAFSNDSRWLYTNHTNRRGDTEVNAWPFVNGRADVRNRRLLLLIHQPYANHNGGHLVVDSTGTLWIGTGDGGSAGDPKRNGQNLQTLLGKVLRIVPTPAASRPYAIPTGNLDPRRGRPEIWAYGLRNPWRFTVDEANRRIWIADVGQNRWEEIDTAPIDAPTPNFGWGNHEGRHPYEGRPPIAEAVEPIFEYEHGSQDSQGCSVTGGYVDASGEYVFADFCVGVLTRVAPDGTATPIAAAKATSPAGFLRTKRGVALVAMRGTGIYEIETSG